jgi:outer membrane lipoprotein-sorting protein
MCKNAMAAIPLQRNKQKDMMMNRFAVLLFGAVALLAVPAYAQEIKGAERAAFIKQAETYLNGITTLKSEFLQTHSDGSRYSGDFYLSRPGRLRFQYRPPLSDYIVADGLLVHYWDSEVKNYSNAPIGSTLADFLLRKKIRLSGDVAVRSVKAIPDNNQVRITLTQSADPGVGSLALIFDRSPLQLRRWQVIDGTGAMTEVSLYKVQTKVAIDPRQFIFKTPKGYETEVDKR